MYLVSRLLINLIVHESVENVVFKLKLKYNRKNQLTEKNVASVAKIGEQNFEKKADWDVFHSPPQSKLL